MAQSEDQWIRQKIQIRICSRCRSIPPVNSEENRGRGRCLCGSYPSERTSLTSNTNEMRTEKVPTNAYGTILFEGFSDNERKYVRAANDENLDTILKLITEKWGLQKPDLLISVTGGAKNFKLKSKLQDEFRRGFLKLAKSTGVWIVSGGTHTGVMKKVGEVVRDYELTSTDTQPVVAIGIATWGCIQNRNKLIRESKSDSSPVEYTVERTSSPDECFLDPYHTHFLLVDDGTQYKFGVEIPFRARLEQKFSQLETNGKVKIPCIQLVLGGGFGTFTTVKETLKMDIPVIIVEGTGRAADVLAKSFQGNVNCDDDVRRFVEDLMKQDGIDPKRLKHIVIDVAEAMKKKHLISVFDVNQTDGEVASEIDRAILIALLKRQGKINEENQISHQIKLAMLWNRIDIAKSNIIDEEAHFKPEELSGLVQRAIEMDQVDFVELLLDQGVSPSQLFKKHMILELYNSKNIKNSLLHRELKRILQQEDKSSESVTFQHVAMLIKKLECNNIFNKYKEKGLCQQNMEMSMTSDISKGDIDNHWQHLFLWAILMNRRELATLFMQRGKDAIATSLVGCKVLHAMQTRTKDQQEKARLEQNAEYFSSFASEVLYECFKTDEEKTLMLLRMPQEKWQDKTCVEIAEVDANKRFLSQTVCQVFFNDIWMGNISEANSIKKIVLCSIVVPLILCRTVEFKYPCVEETKAVAAGSVENLVDGKQERKRNVTFKTVRRTRRPQNVVEDTHNNSRCSNFCSFFQAPIVTFTYGVLSWSVFLLLYAYTILCNFHDDISEIEWFLVAWIGTMVLDELRQVFTFPRTRIAAKIRGYISNPWNMIDCGSFIMFSVSWGIRFADLKWARILLAVTLIPLSCRMLHIFSVHKELGPKLVMIYYMMKDLFYFLLILLVFCAAYSVASFAILFPDSTFTYDQLASAFQFGYWSLYGESMLDILDEECTDNRTLDSEMDLPRCPTQEGRYIVPWMTAVYVLFTNILLINLVIAMFSNTYQRIHDQSDHHWQFHRYRLIMEYSNKPALPPPFIVLSHVVLFVRWLYRKCCSKRSCCRDSIEKAEFSPEGRKKITQWENLIADVYLYRKRHEEVEKVPQWALQVNQRLNELQSQLQMKTSIKRNRFESDTHHGVHVDKYEKEKSN